MLQIRNGMVDPQEVIIPIKTNVLLAITIPPMTIPSPSILVTPRTLAFIGAMLCWLGVSTSHAQVPGICQPGAVAPWLQGESAASGTQPSQQSPTNRYQLPSYSLDQSMTRQHQAELSKWFTASGPVSLPRQASYPQDLLGGGDDPLSQMGPDPNREKQRQQRKEESPKAEPKAAIDPHAELFAESQYPSATQCAKCHQQIYDEWRVSSHAYAAVSPMFHRFEQAVATLTRGTSGTFCMRCHAPIATQLNYPREASIFEGPSVFREGITCIVCHRVVEHHGRVNGEKRVEPGSIYDPVAGSWDSQTLAHVIGDAENYKVKIDPADKRPFQSIHRGAIQFEQLSDSSFCAGCHQVVVQPGIGLEIVYQQYRAGPACKKGISCQDCHMGLVPGKPSGYATAPAPSLVENLRRLHANMPITCSTVRCIPSLILVFFPHNEKSLRWKVEDWLTFDWRSGWGTEAFEKSLPQTLGPNPQFPPAWQLAEDRRDARKIVEANQKLVDVKRANASAVLENSSRIDGPIFSKAATRGEDLPLEFIVTNTSEGHNMPSGSLGAQPQLWLNVVLIAPDGRRVWETGHLDANGDMLDNHSLMVRNGTAQPDLQLVSFQTRFLITNLKGTDREMYLPVNVDIDPLPFFRPGTVPYTVLNHAPFARMESRSIPPLDFRRARYVIPGEALCMPGRYRISVRLRSRVEPIYFVKFVQGTPEMERMLNEGIIDVHPYSSEFEIR